MSQRRDRYTPLEFVMFKILPWVLLVLFIFAMFMAFTGMMGWWD